MRTLRLLLFSGIILLLAAPTAGAATAVPWQYYWRDIANRCADSCNNNMYKCPCQRWYVEVPQ